MMLEKYNFELFADYFQFHLQDEHADFDLSVNIWTEQAVEDLLTVTPGRIYIGTVRNMTVPVMVEVHDSEPKEDFDSWEHITECSFEVSSGKIVVVGGTDYFPEAARIEVAPGTYQARIFYDALDTLSEDGLDGDDNYKIILWRGEETKPKVLKRCAKE